MNFVLLAIRSEEGNGVEFIADLSAKEAGVADEEVLACVEFKDPPKGTKIPYAIGMVPNYEEMLGTLANFITISKQEDDASGIFYVFSLMAYVFSLGWHARESVCRPWKFKVK